MNIRTITIKDNSEFNSVVSHPLQSFEWGEFRRKTGIKVIRRGFFEKRKLVKGFTLTIHKIPKTPFSIGYLPKGDMPNKELIDELRRIGKEEKCIFIQLEPNIILNRHSGEEQGEDSRIDSGQARMTKLDLVLAAHPLFTKYTFVLDLTKSEEELLKAMHPKARYNIKVAKKHGVEIIEDNSEKAFSEYWRLMEETTKRQNFYVHTEKYHKLLRETLMIKDSPFTKGGRGDFNQLTSHLFLAKYKGKILTAWTLFVFKDTLYYPYGASSSENREVMASNLIMWEAIRFGKKLGLKKFDMWGALGPNPNPKDPWYGFHNFKEKYAP
ncbi:peptidoglycan bridge formation glycyltransferase FemA/FemB family protein, partial [Patescibacteria group bacterium]|nr:peptidoglycan bridge formation glycyltransferase FemA/FemB family protein [Patescibacteria group bacterium]